MVGSSPLTRGKLGLLRGGLLGGRLIPAHAGKTWLQGESGGPGRAHPRSRGENLDARFGGELVLGSSPLTRGKPSGMYPSPPVSGAHPRSRGENASHAPHVTTGTGSSPLTRGKPQRRPRARHGPGLIPAHAGKTLTFGILRDLAWAHPRSRGENLLITNSSHSAQGSSPLTRGKHGVYAGWAPGIGLIPAHAGKTGSVVPSRREVRAHPRSRGENSMCDVSLVTLIGSSPLTRGKPRRCNQEPVNWRLIPAHAGKTRPSRRRSL